MTSIIAVIMLLLMFLFGLTYFDPPKEYGIAVNFGTTDYGSGNKQPTEALKPAAQAPSEIEPEEQPVEEVQEEVIEAAAEPQAAPQEVAEEVITQNNDEAIAIKKREEERKREIEEAEKEAKREADAQRKAEAEKKAAAERKAAAAREAEAKRQAEIERKRKEQEAKRRNADAIMGGFSDSDGKADGGEGDDNKAGDKGKVTGDPNASGYYGVGGDGSGGNYRLGNRNALNRPKPDYPCNEEGKVVVTIYVDQSGNVVAAEPGAKGTTNSAPCLLNEAKEAALKTKFNKDAKAPPKQQGAIIYNFSLSE